eukprot:s4156_g2.t1
MSPMSPMSPMAILCSAGEMEMISVISLEPRAQEEDEEDTVKAVPEAHKQSCAKNNKLSPSYIELRSEFKMFQSTPKQHATCRAFCDHS